MGSGFPTRAAHTCPGPTTSKSPSSRADRLQTLRRDLGSALRQGLGTEPDTAACCPTGLPELDRLLGGGLPRGRLCELVGPSSSGRTTLALALLAAKTRGGHCAGWIDGADAFDPASADAAGVALERVLWGRPPSLREALRCAERLLETEGFPLVVLDLAAGQSSLASTNDPPTWLRLARLAAGTQSTLVVLGSERRAGASAHLALELQPARTHWSEGLVLLEQLEFEVVLARHRAAPAGRSVRIATARSRAA